MARHFNRAETAEAMGVSLPTLDRWITEGCPAVTRGSKGVAWAFDLAAVVKWFSDREVFRATKGSNEDLDYLNRRKARAVTEMAELELAKAKKEVAPIAQFERAMSAMCAEVRTNVMNIPQRVAPRLLGETNETKFKTVLREELTLALLAAARAPVVLDEGDGDPMDDIDLDENEEGETESNG